MSNSSALPQLFFSLDESLPEVISLESDSFASESQQELADLFQQSSVASENLVSATPGLTPLPVPNPSPTLSQVAGLGSTPIQIFGDPSASTSTPYNLQVHNGPISFEQTLGGFDFMDVYKFTLNQPGNVLLNITDLSGNADVYLSGIDPSLRGLGADVLKPIGQSLGIIGQDQIGGQLDAGDYYITAANGAYFGGNSHYAMALSVF